MNKRLLSNMLLLLTAAIWGFAFVAQRVGAQYVEAFTFNGVRFALGAISLVPLIIYFDKKKKIECRHDNPVELSAYQVIIPGVLIGLALYMAATLQQMGLMYTELSETHRGARREGSDRLQPPYLWERRSEIASWLRLTLHQPGYPADRESTLSDTPSPARASASSEYPRSSH